MASFNCKKCQEPIESKSKNKSILCGNCGSEYHPFDEHYYLQEVITVGEMIKAGVEDLPDYQDRKELETYLADLKNVYQNGIVKIGILGEFSSGKSTFLNALLENDILPT